MECLPTQCLLIIERRLISLREVRRQWSDGWIVATGAAVDTFVICWLFVEVPTPAVGDGDVTVEGKEDDATPLLPKVTGWGPGMEKDPTSLLV